MKHQHSWKRSRHPKESWHYLYFFRSLEFQSHDLLILLFWIQGCNCRLFCRVVGDRLRLCSHLGWIQVGMHTHPGLLGSKSVFAFQSASSMASTRRWGTYLSSFGLWPGNLLFLWTLLQIPYRNRWLHLLECVRIHRARMQSLGWCRILFSRNHVRCTDCWWCPRNWCRFHHLRSIHLEWSQAVHFGSIALQCPLLVILVLYTTCRKTSSQRWWISYQDFAEDGKQPVPKFTMKLNERLFPRIQCRTHRLFLSIQYPCGRVGSDAQLLFNPYLAFSFRLVVEEDP